MDTGAMAQLYLLCVLNTVCPQRTAATSVTHAFYDNARETLVMFKC